MSELLSIEDFREYLSTLPDDYVFVTNHGRTSRCCPIASYLKERIGTEVSVGITDFENVETHFITLIPSWTTAFILEATPTVGRTVASVRSILEEVEKKLQRGEL